MGCTISTRCKKCYGSKGCKQPITYCMKYGVDRHKWVDDDETYNSGDWVDINPCYECDTCKLIPGRLKCPCSGKCDGCLLAHHYPNSEKVWYRETFLRWDDKSIKGIPDLRGTKKFPTCICCNKGGCLANMLECPRLKFVGAPCFIEDCKKCFPTNVSKCGCYCTAICLHINKITKDCNMLKPIDTVTIRTLNDDSKRIISEKVLQYALDREKCKKCKAHHTNKKKKNSVVPENIVNNVGKIDG